MTSFKSWCRVFVVLGCTLLASASAWAHEAAAVVLFAQGDVRVSSPQGTRTLAKADEVFNQDTITTGSNGRSQLRFTDGGLVSLMPESQFSIEEYLFDPTDEKSSAAFGLLKGGLRTVTGAIGQVKREQYELKTPVATLGIRGTEFTAVLQLANTLRVHVGQGKVVLTNDSGSVEVSAGQNAVVRLGQAPRLSDVAPVFMATAPTGDRLIAMLAVREDPFLLDSVMDVAVLYSMDMQLVAMHTPPPTPPVPEPEPEPALPEPEPEPVLPEPEPEPEPVIPDPEPILPKPTPKPEPKPEPTPPAPPTPPVTSPDPEPEPEEPKPEPTPPKRPVTPPKPPVTTDPGGESGEVTVDPPTSTFESGSITVMDSTFILDSDGSDFSSPDWIVNTKETDLITWGAYEPDPTAPSAEMAVPFISSDQVLMDFEPTGTLSYSIDSFVLSNLQTYSTNGDWALKTFDLDLKLEDKSYGAHIVFEGGYTAGDNFQYQIGSSTHTGSLSDESTSQLFSFEIDDQEINIHMLGDIGICSGCNFNAQGFLAGPNAEEAGVGYLFEGGNGTIYGTVPLKKEGMNVGG